MTSAEIDTHIQQQTQDMKKQQGLIRQLEDDLKEAVGRLRQMEGASTVLQKIKAQLEAEEAKITSAMSGGQHDG